MTINNQNLHDPVPFDGFDVVMFTGFEEFLPYIKRDAAICREKGIKTILGGALATFRPEEMADYVDTVVVGEAEDVLDRAIEGTGIIYGTKPDVDSLPYPDYEGFGVSEYHERNGFKHIGILATRGCPFSCRFCAQTCQSQFRDIDQVMDEVESYGDVDQIVFNDNTFNLNKERFLEICRRMTKPWGAAIRVDLFDEEMAIAAKEGGCEYFVVGIESFRQDKLDEMNKKIKVEQIINCLDLLHKYDIGYHGNILTGFPGESVQDIVKELNEVPEKYNVFPVLVQPFIGTQYKERGISTEEAKVLQGFYTDAAESKNMNVYPTND